jgi:mycobactin peptide synthetase MbtF
VLVFCGRADEQVKIRGFRIEPGEVEAVLAAHPAVRQAAVIAREDQPGQPQLVGYAVPADNADGADGADGGDGAGGGADPAGLRAWLAGQLPDYLVPAAVVLLDALPVTASGKLDRAALPAPGLTGAGGRGPATAAEEAWCALFADVLGLQRAGAEDSFLDMGGDSITSMLLVARAQQAGYAVSVREVFQLQTPAALAAAARPLPGQGDGEASQS